MSPLALTLANLALAALLTIFLYLLPGLALLRLFWPTSRLSWAEQLALGAGLSLAVYPIWMLWGFALGIQPGLLLAIGPALLGLVVLTWHHKPWKVLLSHRSDSARAGWWQWREVHRGPLLVVLLVIFVARLVVVDGMVAPAWGDSVHHTFIVRLMNEHGGLFRSWMPYAPLQTFSYHFGFHAAATAWDMLDGQPTTQSVLMAAQVLNALSILALYPLALRVSGSHWGGIATLVIAGLLSPMPAFYVNYGRYTQLTGQIFLPLLVWALDVWWLEKRRPPLRFTGIVILLTVGIILAHYRVASIAVVAAVAWAIWALWEYRQNPREWLKRTALLAVSGLASIGIIAPWFVSVDAGELTGFASSVLQNDQSRESGFRAEMDGWKNLDTFYPRLLWLGACLTFPLMLWKNRRFAVPLLIWLTLSFLVTNPFLLNLPGTGWVTNFLLILGLYIPLSLSLGWFLGAIVRSVVKRWAAGRLVAFATLGFLVVFGVRNQTTIVDPFYAMVTKNDEDAFQWINVHVGPDARFLVNGFLAYNDLAVVGSDAGWWLPLYTRLPNTVPPILYVTEQLEPGQSLEDIRQIEIKVRDSNGDPRRLRAILCAEGITHIYIGQRDGQVGYGATPAIQTAWLIHNPDMELLYHTGNAQVWSFDRSSCSQ